MSSNRLNTQVAEFFTLQITVVASCRIIHKYTQYIHICIHTYTYINECIDKSPKIMERILGEAVFKTMIMSVGIDS